MLAIKKYIYSKKGFTIVTKDKTIQKVLPNGKLVTKVVKYDCLTSISPQALTIDSTLTLPEVDSISFAAFEKIKNSDRIFKIILPKNLQEIEREHHVLPFFYLKHWATIEIEPGGNTTFFIEDGKLYTTDKYSTPEQTPCPKTVELVYANPYNRNSEYSKASVINLTDEITQQPESKLKQIKTVRINPGAYKQSGLKTITVLLPNNCELNLNSIRTADLQYFGMPDNFVVNGKTVTQSQFLTHGARILIGIENKNGNIFVDHIDGTNEIEKYWNNDEKCETLESWQIGIKREEAGVNKLTRRK